MARDEGDTVTEQVGGAGGGGGPGAGGPGGGTGSGEGVARCAMVTGNPATVTVPLRAPPLFVATENLIVALPVPLDGAPSSTQPTLLFAVQAQPSVAVRGTLTSPPALSTSLRRSVISKTHGAASWLMSTRWSETMKAPRRSRPTGFGATV
jgi:hypothetical protein